MAQGGLLGMGGPAVGGSWAAHQVGTPLGSPWVLGHRKLPLEGEEDGEGGWI